MRLLTTDEVAAGLRTTPDTLKYWRHVGRGPRYIRRGRRVLYDEADVEAYVTAQKVEARAGGAA